MKKTLLVATAVAAAVTCLAWAQPPQGAKETVVIKEEAAAKKPPKETLPNPSAAPKPKVNRDPFVEGGGPVSKDTEAPPIKTPDTPPKIEKKDPNDVTLKDPKKPEVKIAAPQVTLKATLLSAKGNKAIVVGPNTTFIVKQGDKLGDYKVAQITQKQITFTFKDKKFPIKLEDEFAGKK